MIIILNMRRGVQWPRGKAKEEEENRGRKRYLISSCWVKGSAVRREELTARERKSFRSVSMQRGGEQKRNVG